MRNKEYKPDYAVHPGVTLKEMLIAYNMKQIDLSKRIGITEKHISNIINQESPITSETALRLEKVFGVSSEFWNNYQKMYDDTLARIRDEERIIDDINELPKLKIAYNNLAKMNYVKQTRQNNEKVAELRSFFGVSSLKKINQVYELLFRKSSKEADQYSVTAWLRIGEKELYNKNIQEFNRVLLRDQIKNIRKLTVLNEKEFIPKLKEMLFDAGLLFLYLPYFKNSYINGVARWIDKKPIIQISSRNKYQDIFWFSLFHEIAHILNHKKSDIFIEYDRKVGISAEEIEADQFAQNTLIRLNLYKLFVKKSNFSDFNIAEFAKDISIDKGIVAGRLANDGYIAYSKIAHLRRKFYENTI